jgi:hypothetical protein
LSSHHHHHQWTTEPYFADQLQINSSESGNQLKNTVSLNPSETTVVATLSHSTLSELRLGACHAAFGTQRRKLHSACSCISF